uniref:Uncharacterized protein n=1 Tax=viral metagenome TaxID=1070528 RepID=A0A6M3M9E4_9ZZZZ
MQLVDLSGILIYNYPKARKTGQQERYCLPRSFFGEVRDEAAEITKTPGPEGTPEALAANTTRDPYTHSLWVRQST